MACMTVVVVVVVCTWPPKAAVSPNQSNKKVQLENQNQRFTAFFSSVEVRPHQSSLLSAHRSAATA